MIEQQQHIVKLSSSMQPACCTLSLWISLSIPRGPRVVATVSTTAMQALMLLMSWALPWLESVPSFNRITCEGEGGRPCARGHGKGKTGASVCPCPALRLGLLFHSTQCFYSTRLYTPGAACPSSCPVLQIVSMEDCLNFYVSQMQLMT